MKEYLLRHNRAWVGLGMLLTALLHAPTATAAEDAGHRTVDLAKVPSHLRHTALVEFLRARGLATFPKSFASLVRQLTYADASPITGFVPSGRSAQASQADFDQPRKLATAHGANKVASRTPIGFEDYTALNGPDLEGRLYFGHADKPAQAEVLSWNRDRHVFDMFVVTGIDGKSTPVVAEVVETSQCTQCHQNASPIFTLPPWSELLTHDPRKLFRDAVGAKLGKSPRLYRKDGVLLHPEQTPSENNVGLAMDSASSVGNRLVQAARVLREVCGTDRDCRRRILVAALSNLNQSAFLRKNFVADNSAFQVDFVVGPAQRLAQQAAALPTALEPLQRILKRRWPATGFAYISQLLTDPTVGLSGDLPIATLDPRAPRAALLPIATDSAAAYVADVAFETLGFTLEDARLLQTYAPTELVNRFTPGTAHYDASKVDAIIDAWPPTREAILAYVTDGKAGVASVPADVEAKTQVGKHFQTYCLGCHRAGSDNGTIPFDDLDALAAFETKNGNRVQTRLIQATMPPRKAEAQPSAEERQAMAAYLQQRAGLDSAFGPNPPLRRSYLGVRYLQFPGIAGTYVGRTDWTIQEEGVFDGCVAEAPALRVARIGNTKGPVVFSLENFPHYAIGNLVQGPHASLRNGRCALLAVTRNGSLARLDYDMDEHLWVSQILQRNGTVGIGHLAVSHPRTYGRETETLAVGSDGKLYRPLVDGSQLTLHPVSLRGVGEGFGWSRVAFAASSSAVLYLERLDGRILRFRWEGGMATFDKVATREEVYFAPSLLRNDGVLLNPYGPEPEPASSTALTPSELVRWDGTAIPPEPPPTWTAPKPATPPGSVVSGAACDLKASTRECRNKRVGESCTYKSAAGTEQTGACHAGTGQPTACSCY